MSMPIHILMAYTKICECGKFIEALTEGQLKYYFETHLKSKAHKRLLKSIKENDKK